MSNQEANGDEAYQTLVQEATEYEEAQANARLAMFGRVAVEEPEEVGE